MSFLSFQGLLNLYFVFEVISAFAMNSLLYIWIFKFGFDRGEINLPIIVLFLFWLCCYEETNKDEELITRGIVFILRPL